MQGRYRMCVHGQKESQDMRISLYEASVPVYLQLLRATAGCMQKGLEHAREHGYDPQKSVLARIHPDMRPFRYQIRSAVHHSLGAIEAIRAGLFSPPPSETDEDHAGLQQCVDQAIAALERIEPDEVDARSGCEVLFAFGDRRLPFRAEDFLFSFSLPNFHFHVTTAYDILRMLGVPVGKRDYLGRMRFLR
jgi:uncharacterized protein